MGKNNPIVEIHKFELAMTTILVVLIVLMLGMLLGAAVS